MDKPPPSDTARAETEYLKWWHWVGAAFLVILFTALTPRGKSPEYANLVEGSVSQTKVIAPFDFEILKSDEELERERNEAAETILPVVMRVDSIGDTYTRELLRFSSESFRMLSELSLDITVTGIGSQRDSVLNVDSTKFIEKSGELFKSFGFRLAGDTWRFLFKLYLLDRQAEPGIYFRYFENALERILRDVFGQGILNVPKSQLSHPSAEVMMQYLGEETRVPLDRLFTPDEAHRRISVLLSNRSEGMGYPVGSVSAGYEMLQPFIAANIIYDSSETSRRRQAAIAKVPLAKGLVKKDELIIDRNIAVKPEHIAKLKSLAAKRSEMEVDRGGFRVLMPILGYFLLFVLSVGLYWLYIALVAPGVWRDWKLIVLVVLLLALTHLFQVLVPVHYDLSRYMFPVAISAMLIGILVDLGVSIGAVALMAIVAAILAGNDFVYTFGILIAGSASILAIRNVKNRGDVFRGTIYLAAIYLPIVVAFHFIQFNLDQRLWVDLTIAGANAVISPIFVLGLVFIFEKLFRITTDLSLLELVDLNRPLLRELAIKSPGTYHHSIMVGSLAEAAAREIGANALLTRAGAYYHDIGKMKNKEFFIENQEAGSENVHEKLPPSKSVEVVVHHVTYGVELADKHKLPPQIKDFIREHHGRSKLAYFLAKAKQEQGEDVPEDRFRYPGPNPQSKETGILMLADSIEAAARSLDNDNYDELKSVVDKLIRQRVRDGDLDECPLTLREINRIRDAFLQVLSGMHHHRIPYPEEDDPVAKVEKAAVDNGG